MSKEEKGWEKWLKEKSSVLHSFRSHWNHFVTQVYARVSVDMASVQLCAVIKVKPLRFNSHLSVECSRRCSGLIATVANLAK